MQTDSWRLTGRCSQRFHVCWALPVSIVVNHGMMNPDATRNQIVRIGGESGGTATGKANNPLHSLDQQQRTFEPKRHISPQRRILVGQTAEQTREWSPPNRMPVCRMTDPALETE